MSSLSAPAAVAALPATPRLIDPRGQRFGAGVSALVLVASAAVGLVPVVPLLAAALGVSAVFGRPWPVVRRALRLGPPSFLEPETPPRFAQALGATVLVAASIAFLLALPVLGWTLALAVAGLQGLLALTGICVGCRLYGLTWAVPALFDRLLGVPSPPRTRLVRARVPRAGS
jgi:hypothetical protein